MDREIISYVAVGLGSVVAIGSIVWFCITWWWYDDIHRVKDVSDMKKLLKELTFIKEHYQESEYHLVRGHISWVLVSMEKCRRNEQDIIYMWDSPKSVSWHLPNGDMVLDLSFGGSTRKLPKDIRKTFQDIIDLYGDQNGQAASQEPAI